MKVPAVPLIVAGVAVLAVAGLAVLVWRKGGAAGAGAAVGAAAVEAAGGAVSGAVGAAGAAVGLPTPAETLTDARQVRYLIDRFGYLTASQWAGAPALFEAWRMQPGTGTAPPAAVLQRIGTAPAAAEPSRQATPAELDYPAWWSPPSSATWADLADRDPYTPWASM